jgi:CheY-like chemotaxis protein
MEFPNASRPMFRRSNNCSRAHVADTCYSIMVVDTDAATLLTTADVLRKAGHHATTASSFQEARRMLESSSPDLLITEIRLGAFNGLHLAVRRRLLQPQSASIVASAHSDRMLEHEARAMNVPYMLKPLDPGELLSLVNKMLRATDDSEPPALRRWPRRRIAGGFEAIASGSPALVLNVSDEGIGLEMYCESPGDLTPASFELSIPAFGLTISAEPVWKSIDEASGIVRCGATIVRRDDEKVDTWREFVDALT